MLISSLLNHNCSNHHNVLEVLLANLKRTDLMTRPFQPSRMKLGYNTLCGVVDELLMTLPMVILSFCGETCFGGQGRKFMVRMYERKREIWFVKLDVRTTLFLETRSGGRNDRTIFPSSMESQFVILRIRITIVKNFLHLNSVRKWNYLRGWVLDVPIQPMRLLVVHTPRLSDNLKFDIVVCRHCLCF